MGLIGAGASILDTPAPERLVVVVVAKPRRFLLFLARLRLTFLHHQHRAGDADEEAEADHADSDNERGAEALVVLVRLAGGIRRTGRGRWRGRITLRLILARRGLNRGRAADGLIA